MGNTQQGINKQFKTLKGMILGDSKVPPCTTNYALVFIKPHATNDAVIEFVRKHLEANKIAITDSGMRDSSELSELIDQHYQIIHKAAMLEHPRHLKLSEEKKAAFKEQFNIDWDLAVADGRILNLSGFQEKHGSEVDIGKEWDHKNTSKMGLGPGTAVGKLMRKDADGDYQFVINGFYADMRNEFVGEGSKVFCFKVLFEEADLSFEDFRNKVIGSTNPEKAVKGSLRANLLEEWESLGLDEKPNYGKNGVHASAGPIEGLYERNLWYGTPVEEDPFGKKMLAAHVDLETIEYMMGNKEIDTGDGKLESAFVVTENMNSSQVIQEALALQDLGILV